QGLRPLLDFAAIWIYSIRFGSGGEDECFLKKRLPIRRRNPTGTRCQNQIKMSTKQDKRKILADILAGRATPDAIPGEGCLTITPDDGGLVNVDGRLMNGREAKRAINKAATIIFFEGDDDDNELFNELSADPSYVIDFNSTDHDLNDDNG
ncbi:MAG: hypothetical protein SFV55_28585, partial [Haliscomenobacter sp.]|uniref:hypothetical protein n=1 Tax=Haliscomenobacter sp. TaxID=2717303 RepID=UPI0029BE4370